MGAIRRDSAPAAKKRMHRNGVAVDWVVPRCSVSDQKPSPNCNINRTLRLVDSDLVRVNIKLGLHRSFLHTFCRNSIPFHYFYELTNNVMLNKKFIARFCEVNNPSGLLDVTVSLVIQPDRYCPEPGDQAPWDYLLSELSEQRWAEIPAHVLRSRLATTLKMAKQWERRRGNQHADDDHVTRQYRDFVEVCEFVEHKYGEPPVIEGPVAEFLIAGCEHKLQVN